MTDYIVLEMPSDLEILNIFEELEPQGYRLLTNADPLNAEFVVFKRSLTDEL